MNHRSVDIFGVVAITIIAIALAFVLPPNWVPGRILSLPLVLVLPGYALTAAALPEQARGVPERLAFSLGLSLAIVILSGLLLNLMPFGLRSSSWAVLLGSITLGASVVALVRRRGQSTSASGWLRVGSVGFTFRQGVLLGLAVIVVGGAVAVSIIGTEHQPYPGFTQLWILPASEANAKNAVQLGINNKELTVMEYSLVVNVNGKVVKEWFSIGLSPNEKWGATLVLPQAGHASAARVEADLYRADAPTTIYRHVVLWLDT